LQGLSLGEARVTLGGLVTLKGGGTLTFAPAAGQPFAVLIALGVGFDDSARSGTAAEGTLAGEFALMTNGNLGVRSFTGLQGFSPATPTLKLGEGFEVSGGLAFGSVKVNNQDILYAKISGAFKVAAIGAGIELGISQLGPVVATVSAPLAIPLDPSGLM